MESIRREYHLWKYGTEPRLQRVLTITLGLEDLKVNKPASGRHIDLGDVENPS